MAIAHFHWSIVMIIVTDVCPVLGIFTENRNIELCLFAFGIQISKVISKGLPLEDSH